MPRPPIDARHGSLKRGEGLNPPAAPLDYSAIS